MNTVLVQGIAWPTGEFEMKELIERLREFARAAKGWSNVTEIHTATDDDPLVMGASDDGTFYPLVTIDAENYGHDSMPLAEFYAAANPREVIKLLDALEQLRHEVTAWSAKVANLEAERDSLRDTVKSLVSQNMAMTAERDALKSDAARWVYWRDYHGFSGYFDEGATASPESADIDAACDAAMKRVQP